MQPTSVAELKPSIINFDDVSMFRELFRDFTGIFWELFGTFRELLGTFGNFFGNFLGTFRELFSGRLSSVRKCS
jgi:hypothetical protein